MSTCSNCYNGCTEIVSDRCVKYTGIDVPVLGIKTGDSLSFVEQALITFLTSTLDGTGVIIDLSGINICTLVQKYLPTCKDLSIADISKALIQAACDLQVQVTANTNAIATLNADYTIGCLTGVTASSDTHVIVQAVINKLCTVVTDLADLTTELHTMYSSNGTQLNNYIASYLAGLPSTNVANARMVPLCPIPYYGPLSGYPNAGDSLSLTGPGTGYWDKIYLCNGLNGTPDLRGRAIVGTTTMGNNTFPSQTNPCGSCTTCANPAYDLGTVAGTNCVTLTTLQLPSHNHLVSNAEAETIITPEKHNHGWTGINGTGWPDESGDRTGAGSPNSYPVTTQQLDVTLTAATTISLTIDPAGGGDPHPNIQPVIALHYIMYIP
jgi:microcystin-dependent protein